MDYISVNTPPTPEEYCYIRKECGLSEKSINAAEIALPKSLFAVKIIEKSSNYVVGMGRIIGDLGCFVQVVDIAVLPKYQGNGLSRIIMTKIMSYIHSSVPLDCHVTLLSDVDFLYEKFGYIDNTRSKPMVLSRN